MAKKPIEGAADEARSSGGAILLRQFSTYAVCGVAAAVFWFASRYLSAHHAGFWVMMASTFVYGAVILAVCYGAVRLKSRVAGCVQSPAAKRYQRRIMVGMSFYVLLLICAIGAYIRLHPTGAFAYLLALAPALPVVACIVVMGLYVREETDEFERSIQIEGALWATGGLLAVATVWGFLEMFRLVPHVESWWAFPVWAVIWGPAQVLARRRYW
jgi:hypothetical protein